MAPDAGTLVTQAEQAFAASDVGGALAGLGKAYVPVQGTRDLETVRRALALARRMAAADAASGRQVRKARQVEEWYVELERSYSGAAAAALIPAGAATDSAAAGPSLAWIDGLVGLLGAFLAFELIVGVLVALAATTTVWRVWAVAAAVFWATLLAAVIAVLRLLQRIERNTRP